MLNFIAFDLFHVIAFLMFGGLLFVVVMDAVTNLRHLLEERRRRKMPDPDFADEILVPNVSAGFHLREPQTALRRLDFHRIPARTLSWTGSQLVGRAPAREELHIGS